MAQQVQGMGQRLSVGQNLGLEQRLSARLIESIKMMEVPVMELRDKINEELDRNPALEVISDKSTVSLDHALAKGQKKESDDYFEASSDPGWTRSGGDQAADDRRQFLEGALSLPETLQQHLLWGLSLERTDAETRSLAETVIGNLNDDGFHITPPEVLFKDKDPAKVRFALDLVRGLDPVGCATSNYKESLAVQIRLLPGLDRHDGIILIRALDCMGLLEKGKYAAVAEKLGLDDETFKRILALLKSLVPFPGRQFAAAAASEGAHYVTPDIEVVKRLDGNGETGFSVILNDEEIPVLGLNPFFLKIADEKGRLSDTEKRSTRDFVRENVKEARWFIQSINERNQTLLRVTRAIVHFQRDFFEKGPAHLLPLTLADIAGELGVSESTVSRTANSKYVQTEWGLYALRHFFSNSISGKGSGGSSFSQAGVKEMIKDIVGGSKTRLSDQGIADELAKRGVKLARRTVAKYRKELDLGSSYVR
jgi:RNA polymerase sigma-54 factor